MDNSGLSPVERSTSSSVSRPITAYCYYCGIDATTEEHAPPQAIFPQPKDSPDGRNYRKNLIKVPSCEAHNTKKSKEDEYLLYVLVMSLPSNEVAKSQFLTKIRRAIERRPKLLRRLLIETREVVVHDTANDTWHRTIAIKPEGKRLVGVFTRIAKALYFHEMKCPWQGRISVLSEFMLSFDDITQNERQRQVEEQLNSMLMHVPYKGENLHRRVSSRAQTFRACRDQGRPNFSRRAYTPALGRCQGRTRYDYRRGCEWDTDLTCWVVRVSVSTRRTLLLLASS